MRVKVLKAHPSAWSAYHIGEIFEVEEYLDKRFYVLSCDIHNDDEKRLLKKENCEIVQPLNPKQ